MNTTKNIKWVGIFNPVSDSFIIKDWISAQALKKELEEIKIPVLLVGESENYDQTMLECQEFTFGFEPILD